MARPGRNESCPCGSGRKFKQCCAAKTEGAVSTRLILVAIGAAILFALLFGASTSRDGSDGRVWSPEHGHYHDAQGREVPR